MPRRILIDNRPVNCVLQIDGFAARALNIDRLMLDRKRLPIATVGIFVGILRIFFLHIQVLLVDSHDGKAPRDVLVVTKRNTGQRGFTCTNHVPPGRNQMNRLAQ